MASYSVQYIFTLLDKFTPGARKLGSAAQAMSKAVHAAGKNVGASAAGLTRYGAAASAAAKQVTSLYRAARQSQGALGGRRGGGRMGGGFGGIGGLIPGFTLFKVLQQAREASKAENKFRSLVDSVTDQEMSDLKTKIQKQMRYTGESFSELMDATGEAAQIVGNAGLAGDITMAASSLSRIDSAKKKTGFFADAIAAAVGKDARPGDVDRFADMLAAQQKLGAATAGGSIEAYKNVVLEKSVRKFDPVEMLTAIGMIKNISPATQDSQIGNLAKYGVGVLSSPIPSMLEKMNDLGLTAKSFETDGKFDIGKTQKLFYNMRQTPKGLQNFKDLFAGKNRQAGQFWSVLGSIDPKEFDRYKNALIGSTGELWKSLRERLVGLDGTLTRLEGAGFSAALAIGEWLTPALMTLATWAEYAVDSIGPMLSAFSQSHPELSKWAAMAALVAVSLSLLAIPLAAVAFSLRMLGARAAVGALWGLGAGVVGAAAGIASMAAGIYRVAGAAALAKFALGSMIRIFAIGAAVEGLVLLYQNWEKLKFLAADPLEFKVIFPEAPEWLMRLWDTAVKSSYSDAQRNDMAWSGDAADRKYGAYGGGFMSAYGNLTNADAYRRAQEASDQARRTYSPFQQMQGYTPPDSTWFSRAFKSYDPAWGNGSMFGPQGNPAFNAAQIPQSMAINVSSTTSFEPAQLTVNVTGQVNGAVTGTGSATLNAKPSRGTSTSEAGGGPSYDNPGMFGP